MGWHLAMLGYHNQGVTGTSWVDTLNILQCIVYRPHPHPKQE